MRLHRPPGGSRTSSSTGTCERAARALSEASNPRSSRTDAWMPRASCRSSVIAAFVEVCASSMSAWAAVGSSSIFCCARPRVIATETSRGCTPSCRSRSMRVRSTSPARTALSRCVPASRACSTSWASRFGTRIARVSTPWSTAMPASRAAQTMRPRTPTSSAHSTATWRPVTGTRTVSPPKSGANSSTRLEASPPTSGSTNRPRMVETAADAMPRHIGPSVNWSQTLLSHPANPGRSRRRARRAGRPYR